MLEDLTDEEIKSLVKEHWREIVGLSKEIQRRRHAVSNPDQADMDTGHRDGWVAG